MDVSLTPEQRRLHKQSLIGNILKIEKQIQANINDDKVLPGLRADYRRACDELATYYDDITEERPKR